MMTERSGVEIDYCPKCRGVWLDRGELDKLIEKSAGSGHPMTPSYGAQQPPPPPQYGHMPPQGQPRRRDDDSVDEDYDPRRHGGRRRKSWLGEILDFD
jgi:hypothetical protein